MQGRMEYRSLFWPLLLIGVGVIWLLSNTGVLSVANISVLARLWPLLLIVIGLDLLYGRQSPRLGALIGVGALALIIVLMLVGPALGWAADVDVKSASYDEPLGDASTAQITVGAGVGGVTVRPLRDSTNLFEADITYVGQVDFSVGGGSNRVLNLSQRGETSFNIGFLGFLFNPDQQLEWNVRINPDVPLDLIVNAGTGGLTLDLSDFAQLTGVQVDAGTGGMDVTLPATESRYEAKVSAGTGGSTIRIEDGASLDLTASAGTGGFTIDVPDDAAVRLVASTGTGGITVPSFLKRVGGEDNSFVGDSGTWETDGFTTASNPITIEFDGGTGGLTVQ
ncbi:MAG: hypothetical protein HZC41_03950 [Chloroflexi bacterium]|nr:hypothetical protein [Chloroflexota bacterium]